MIRAHEEFRDEFKELCAVIRISFSQLDQRNRTLETDISTLKARMDRFETHRAQPVLPIPPASSISPHARTGLFSASLLVQ